MNTNEYIQGLAHLARGLTKQAAMGVGGQQVMPTQFVNPASGMYDPNPINALYSQLSQARADANASRILDGQVSGTNLLPYRPVLNEGYGTIRSAMNVQMAGKTASAPDENPEFTEEEFAQILDNMSDEEFANIMAETGLFEYADVVPGKEDWEAINENALQKAASYTDEILIDMYNTGVLHQENPQIVPYIEDAFRQVGYLE